MKCRTISLYGKIHIASNTTYVVEIEASPRFKRTAKDEVRTIEEGKKLNLFVASFGSKIPPNSNLFLCCTKTSRVYLVFSVLYSKTLSKSEYESMSILGMSQQATQVIVNFKEDPKNSNVEFVLVVSYGFWQGPNFVLDRLPRL